MNIYDYKEILYKVYELAAIEGNKVRAKDEQENLIQIDKSFLDYIVKDRQNSKLLQYLNTLDAETIRIVMTVMYIGRDYPQSKEELLEKYLPEEEYHSEYDGIPQEPEVVYPVSNPSKEVQHYMDYINSSDKKEIEINQIFSKRRRLAEYLERAFMILGI